MNVLRAHRRTCNVLLYGLLRHPSPGVNFDAAVDVCRFMAEGGFAVSQLTFTSLISGLHKRGGTSALPAECPRSDAATPPALMSRPHSDEPIGSTGQAIFGERQRQNGDRWKVRCCPQGASARAPSRRARAPVVSPLFRAVKIDPLGGEEPPGGTQPSS